MNNTLCVILVLLVGFVVFLALAIGIAMLIDGTTIPGHGAILIGMVSSFVIVAKVGKRIPFVVRTFPY